MNFCDTSVKNTGTGSYEFNVYRKEAITNVQIKPNSSHDEKVKYGVFKGFVHRAMTICSEKYVKDELELLVKMFVENGYSEKPRRNIIKNYKLSNTRDPNNRKKIVSLPYVSTISKKLRTKNRFHNRFQVRKKSFVHPD